MLIFAAKSGDAISSPDLSFLGDRDADTNDPSNEGRSLLLLRAQGLITLCSNIGLLPTSRDIENNPNDIHIKELDAGIVGRAIVDLDAAVINTDWAIKAGIKNPQERIAQEQVTGNPYRNFTAVNEEDAHAPWVHDLVENYQQPNVAAEILSVYHGATARLERAVKMKCEETG
jgi:D-methionine transport system substrate-binding protein